MVDEVAAAAELVTAKLGGRPLTRVRGLGAKVLPPGEHGPGARSLVRPVEQDMFALGSREAVLAALAGEQPTAFGAPAPVEDVITALVQVGLDVRHQHPPEDDPVAGPGLVVPTPDDRARWRLEVAAYALGWRVSSGSDERSVVHPRAL